MTAWIWVLVGLAWADWTVEGPGMADRTQANADARVAKDAGLKSRVVRRFAEGAGWEYAVRVEGLADEPAALAAAQRLASAWQDPVRVVDGNGKEVEVVSAGAPVAAPQPTTSETPVGTGAPLLDRAIEVHGGGLSWLAGAERVRLEYVRVLPDGKEVTHVWARRGTDLYLAISAQKGDVVPSRTLVIGDAAWLAEGSAKDASQDVQRARETIERFGATSLVPVVLELERASADHPELEGLIARGTARVDDQVCAVAQSRPGQADVMLAFGEKDGLVRRIAFDDGARVHEFGAYREVSPGVRVPFDVRTTIDGALRDHVRITAFEVDGELPAEWFRAP